jgi:SAM-dependent methyltransferase
MDNVAYQQFEELERTHWWLRGRRRVYFDLLDHLLPRGRKLSSLDVGCGFGGMILELQRYGPAAGVDIFPEAVEVCRRRGIEDVREGSAYELPVGDAGYDLVAFFDCIEHLDDDLAALRESYRALRPGGHVVVTVPAYNFLYANNDKVVHHKRRYTVRRLRKRLESAGFEVRKATYVNIALFPLILPIVLLKKLKERLRPVEADPTTNLTHTPPKPLNELLFRIFSCERYALRRVSSPVGHSIFALAVKPGGDGLAADLEAAAPVAQPVGAGD